MTKPLSSALGPDLLGPLGHPPATDDRPHPYAGRSAVLATMHHKEQAVAPAFAQALGLNVVVTTDLDTDALGTFSGETPRRGTMLETALAKARLGMRASGLPLAIASEGSFGPHPEIPFLAAGIELLVFVAADRASGADTETVIHETRIVAQTNFAHRVTAPFEDIDAFLAQVGFPAHGLIVRPNAGSPLVALHKGIVERGRLDQALNAAAAASTDGRARIETDMRAHLNPTRMAMLAQLSTQLAQRVAARCPACAAPGWGRIDTASGLPCELCGTPTEMIAAEIFGCASCGHREPRARSDGLLSAPPGRCPACNP